MSTIQHVYRFSYTVNGNPREEFYTTHSEAEYFRDQVMKVASHNDQFKELIYTNVSPVRAVVVWNNVRAELEVAA
jgi:hypothetical protein